MRNLPYLAAERSPLVGEAAVRDRNADPLPIEEFFMQNLVAGYERFRTQIFPQYASLFASLETSQSPSTLFLTCSDSRIVPDLLLQTDPGELFICRNAGNIVPPYGDHRGGVSATIEYAVCALKVKDIVVCGHSDCGAMKAVANGGRQSLEKLRESMPTVASWLGHAEPARQIMEESGVRPGDTRERLRVLTRANVVQQLNNLRTHPSVAAQLHAGRLSIHGWTYDIPTGSLEAFDGKSGRFIALTGSDAPRAIVQPGLQLTA